MIFYGFVLDLRLLFLFRVIPFNQHHHLMLQDMHQSFHETI